MTKSLLSAACAAALAAWATVGSAQAQSPPAHDMSHMEGHGGHHHHDDGKTEKLGKVSFPTSCAPAQQAEIEHGVALLHSFGYVKAQQTFEAVAKADPKCAIAHWGVAMSQFHQLWEQPDADALKRGAAEMAAARAAGKPSAREAGYIDALGAFYDPADAKFQDRAAAYETKMAALQTANPDDVEAAAFHALSLLAATPPNDTSLAYPRRALAILKPLFAAHPDHPGLAHYIIHTCDTPALAGEALEASRAYAKIAPASAHALHMPAHIFSRLGMWKESIASNLASVKASNAAAAAHEPGAAHQMHADEFLIYAYLQTGQDEKARALTAKMSEVGAHMMAMPGMDDMKDAGHFFDNELRAVFGIEMHDWAGLRTIKPGEGSRPEDTSLIYWAQGVAAGHLKDARLAASALADFDKVLSAVKASAMADYLMPGLAIVRDEMLGWQAFAGGDLAGAEAAMRRAADQQDKIGQNEVDIPAREMLGDLLLLAGKPDAALAEYKVALQLSPNRLNGLLSAGAAAKAAGKPDEAREYFKRAAIQTNNAAASKRPELLAAVKAAKGANKPSKTKPKKS